MARRLADRGIGWGPHEAAQVSSTARYNPGRCPNVEERAGAISEPRHWFMPFACSGLTPASPS